MNIISLGAGVQSSTMALMAAKGELGYHVDCAIFADTGAEPQKIYDWLNWLEMQCPFPVHRVSNGSLLDNIMSEAVKNGTDTDRFVSVPFFTDHKGSAGMTRRQCTREFKIEPIQRKVRELLGLQRGQRGPREVVVQQLIGISMDEIQRMKDSGKRYIRNVYPLIDKGMSRWHCLEWMKENGYPMPPKSACTFCPYHDDAMWRDMKLNDPDSWDQAVAVDRHIRGGESAVASRHVSNLYLHRSLKPLEEVDLRSAEDYGQKTMFDPLGFNNECEGMCGV